jgi:hypothetical protein
MAAAAAYGDGELTHCLTPLREKKWKTLSRIQKWRISAKHMEDEGSRVSESSAGRSDEVGHPEGGTRHDR